MKIILNEKIDTLGEAGQVVSVKSGYARNYLFPRGLATVASEKNKRDATQVILSLGYLALLGGSSFDDWKAFIVLLF